MVADRRRRRRRGPAPDRSRNRVREYHRNEGKTVSAFIVSSALETAGKTMERHETMTLARRDAVRFFDALANPLPPNERLRSALEEHTRRVISR